MPHSLVPSVITTADLEAKPGSLCREWEFDLGAIRGEAVTKRSSRAALQLSPHTQAPSARRQLFDFDYSCISNPSPEPARPKSTRFASPRLDRPDLSSLRYSPGRTSSAAPCLPLKQEAATREFSEYTAVETEVAADVRLASLARSHSFSLTTFSPSGKLVQIEHALAAVGQGTTSLGIKGESAVSRSTVASAETRQREGGQTTGPRTARRAFILDASTACSMCDWAGLTREPLQPRTESSSRHQRRRRHRSSTTLCSKRCDASLSEDLTDLGTDPIVDPQVALICPNIGMVYSGMGPDFRVLVAKARKSAQAYWKIYGEYPSTRVMVGEIATVMQDATQSG